MRKKIENLAKDIRAASECNRDSAIENNDPGAERVAAAQEYVAEELEQILRDTNAN